MELPVKVAIVSGSILLFSILFGWVGFPALFKYGIKSVVTLHPNSEIRKTWQKIPFAIDFKMYVFNVTNARDVQNGDTPVLDEIGPYHYDAWREKVDMVDNDEDDTVEFNPKITWYFNEAKSKKLTGEELVTIPHPLIMSMLLKTAVERPTILPLAFKAVNSIFDNPESIFLTAKVKDILFDGVYVNCNVSDFIGQMACDQMKTANTMKSAGENALYFSFFGHKNGTLEDRMKVKRGVQNSKDLNRVVAFRNSSELDVWETEQCNELRGTESTMFPPLISEGQSMSAFAPFLCRSMDLIYVKQSKYRNIPVSLYTTSFGDPAKNPEYACFCTNKERCHRKGTMDLSKCTGAPIIVTFPHFYDTDLSYLKSIRGLHPDPEKHRVELYFEPITGTILMANNRLQFNFDIQKLPNISLTENLRNLLIPLLWMDEGVNLNTTYLQHLDKEVFLFIHINDVLKWTLLVISAAGLAVAIYMISHLRRGFSLSGFHLREQELEVETLPDKSAMISSLSEIVHHKESKTSN